MAIKLENGPKGWHKDPVLKPYIIKEDDGTTITTIRQMNEWGCPRVLVTKKHPNGIVEYWERTIDADLHQISKEEADVG